MAAITPSKRKHWKICTDPVSYTHLVADLVAGYPDAQTLFIGLFVVGGGAQGKGLGRRLMTELAARARAKGVRHLRLGCVEENTAGHKFWLAMGFRDVARREHAHHGRALLVMERDC